MLRLLQRKLRKQARASQTIHIERDIDVHDDPILMAKLNLANMSAPENAAIMAPFTRASREEFALRTKTMVYYLPEEVEKIRLCEETAAMRAAPLGVGMNILNGLNIGCGDRWIHKSLIPVDIMREAAEEDASGAHHAFLSSALLANPEDLPFKEQTVDFIVALHMLEHVSNPTEILNYWGTILKPGGGIGLILPDFRYTWNARGDFSTLGHKWNTSAEIFRALFERDLRDSFTIESIDTLPYKISFDVVLRKPGTFVPFNLSNVTSKHAGSELADMGQMISENLGCH